MKNLVLIGMPGSGKTKLARLLARQLSMTAADTDAMVEEAAGQTIPALFAQRGEAGFRAMETAAVQRAAALSGAVIATGGGVILREENMAALRRTGVVFFRDRRPEAIAGEEHSGRPLIGGDRERVFRLYHERVDLYRKYADHIIPHTDTLEEAAALIGEIWAKEEG